MPLKMPMKVVDRTSSCESITNFPQKFFPWTLTGVVYLNGIPVNVSLSEANLSNKRTLAILKEKGVRFDKQDNFLILKETDIPKAGSNMLILSTGTLSGMENGYVCQPGHAHCNHQERQKLLNVVLELAMFVCRH